MAKLQSTHPEDETFDAKFKVLTESIQDHIQEEERQLFSKSKKLLDKEMDRLGEKMEALEKKLEG